MRLWGLDFERTKFFSSLLFRFFHIEFFRLIVVLEHVLIGSIDVNADIIGALSSA